MAAPALGIAVGVVGCTKEAAAFLEVVGDLAPDVARILALEPAVSLDESRHLVDRNENRKLLRL